MRFGSDLVVEWLVDLGVTHVAINPGASLRGLHESLVREPRITTVLALHEEVAVGIAHGYWKATGRPMAVLLHDLVGVQNASMALFNATLDRAAMLVVGGAGPRDETARRPWLDWIHAADSHAGPVRGVVKRATEPRSLTGVRDALVRAWGTCLSTPTGPVYVAVDVEEQEVALEPGAAVPPAAVPPAPFVALPPPERVAAVADLLRSAAGPVVLVDRPCPDALGPLLQVLESVPAPVVDLGGGFGFPAAHWAQLHSGRAEVLAGADLVLALGVRDLAWALSEVDTGTRASRRLTPPGTTLVAIGDGPLLDVAGIETEQLVPEAEYLACEPAAFAAALAAALAGDPAGDPPREPVGDPAGRRAAVTVRHEQEHADARKRAAGTATEQPVHPAWLALALHEALGDGGWVLANGVLRDWPRRLWDFGAGNRFLGRSGGEGLGYGTPAALGAALALRDDPRLVVNLAADGDLLYTPSVLWTAAAYELPLLTVVHNNGSYGKDELHQRELARLRGRPQDTTHIGVRLDSPRVDFAQLARSQGVHGIGPVTDPAELPAVLAEAAAEVRAGRPVLVDVICR